MSCWVVPAVAADLWGMPLEQVLEAIRLGKVPSKEDYHFVLVDVAPDTAQADSPGRNAAPRPMTFTLVTHEETDDVLAEDEANDDGDQSGRLDWMRARRSVVRQPPCMTRS